MCVLKKVVISMIKNVSTRSTHSTRSYIDSINKKDESFIICF